MAIFHMSVKVISRGKGQSAVAAAAYRSGEKLRDYQTGETKDYQTRAERIVFEGVFAPKDAPEWAKDRESLWNHVEAFEKRKNSQLAREIEVSLPHEMTDQQREWLLKDFIREQFTRKGFAVDAAIHAPDRNSDERNYHAHLMVTMRRIEGQEFESHKDRSLNSKEQLKEWREEWAALANRHLERHGHEARIDHRSLFEQGIDREPTIHVGYAGMQMDARGAQSDRMDELRGIMARNDAIRVLREEGRPESGREAPAEPAPLQSRGAFTNRLMERPETPAHLPAHAPQDFVDIMPPEGGAGQPPPREDRHDPHAEDFEREDEGGPTASPRGVRVIGGAVDALSNGVGGLADKAADVLLSLFSSGKGKPVADDKEQKGQTPAQAWQKAAETSRAANAAREKDIIHQAEKKTHRPLEANERDAALRRGDKER